MLECQLPEVTVETGRGMSGLVVHCRSMILRLATRRAGSRHQLALRFTPIHIVLGYVGPHINAGADSMASEYDFDLTPDPEEDEEYIQYDIATYPSDFTLKGIQELWNNGDLVIPEFQREFVWSIKQSSLLIESFLMGLPVPPVFFYIDEENKSMVIDGQQRIMSIVFFFEGYFGLESVQGKRQVFRLNGLSSKSPSISQS